MAVRLRTSREFSNLLDFRYHRAGGQMQQDITRTERSKWTCRGLLFLTAACWGFTLINVTVFPRDFSLEGGEAKQTISSILADQPIVFSSICGVVSAVLCLLISWHTAPRIVLHPENDVWDPIKLLRKKTAFRYAYRSLSQLEGQKCKRPHALIPLSDKFGVYLADNGAAVRNNNYVFMCANTGKETHALSNKAQLANHPLQDYLPKTYGHDDVCYPCILKFSEGYLSNGVFRIDNEEQLRAKARSMILNEEYIIQEAIVDSREYSTQFVVDDGKIVFQCGYYDNYETEIFIWPRDKRVSRARFLLDPQGEAFKIFEQFFEGYTGLINCNYKIKHGQMKILEFNPRLSGDIYAFSRTDLQKLILKYLELCS